MNLSDIRYRLERKSDVLTCEYDDEHTVDDLSRICWSLHRGLTAMALDEQRYARPMRVRCVETGVIYAVYAVKSPERVDIMPHLPWRAQQEKRRQGIERFYVTTPLSYVIEDVHGNLAGTLTADDCEVV